MVYTDDDSDARLLHSFPLPSSSSSQTKIILQPPESDDSSSKPLAFSLVSHSPNLSASACRISHWGLLLSYASLLSTSSYSALSKHPVLSKPDPSLPAEFHPSNTLRHLLVSRMKASEEDDVELAWRRLGMMVVTEKGGAALDAVKDVVAAAHEHADMRESGPELLKTLTKIHKALPTSQQPHTSALLASVQDHLSVLSYLPPSCSASVTSPAALLRLQYSKGLFSSARKVVRRFSIPPHVVSSAVLAAPPAKGPRAITHLSDLGMAVDGAVASLAVASTASAQDVLKAVEKYLRSRPDSRVHEATSSAPQRQSTASSSSPAPAHALQDVVSGLRLSASTGVPLSSALSSSPTALASHLAKSGEWASASSLVPLSSALSLGLASSASVLNLPDLFDAVAAVPDAREKAGCVTQLLHACLAGTVPYGGRLPSLALSAAGALPEESDGRAGIEAALRLIALKDLARRAVGSDEGMRPNDPDHVRKVLNAVCSGAGGEEGAKEDLAALRDVSGRECGEERVDFLRLFWAARAGQGGARVFRGTGSEGVRRFGLFASGLGETWALKAASEAGLKVSS